MLKITVKSDDAKRGIGLMASRLQAQGPAWRVIGTRLLQSVRRNFRQGGWYPAVWPVSSRAQMAGGQTLIQTGVLRNSFLAQHGADWASVGSAQVYAAIHQFGGTITAKNAKVLRFKIGDRWISKRSVVIPPRPMLPVRFGVLHPDDSEYIRRVIGSWVVRGKASAS